MTLDRAKFEAVRDDLLAKRADIDRLVGALNVLLGDDLLMSPRIVVDVAPEPPRSILPQKKPIAALRGGPRIATTRKHDPDAEKQAKALFMAGMMLNEIAAEIGWPPQRVYYWSHRGKWRQERDSGPKKSPPVAPREPETFVSESAPKQELTLSPIPPRREKRRAAPEPTSTRAEDLAQIARADAILREEAEAEAAGLTFRCPTCYGRCDKQEGHPECLGRKPKDGAVGLVHWKSVGAFGSRGAFE